jgi:hypothetical protein
LLARGFVDQAVAVVILVVTAHLDVARIHRGIGVIAIAAGHAVYIGNTVPVGVAQRVHASLGFLDARIDGASMTVVAVLDRPLLAPQHRVANLDAVAKDSILAPRIVSDELATVNLAVAGIERTSDTVVTLSIFEAGPTERSLR